MLDGSIFGASAEEKQGGDEDDDSRSVDMVCPDILGEVKLARHYGESDSFVHYLY